MSNFKNQLLGNKYFSWMQIFTNWLMQGVVHADKSEKRYKILFTLFFWLLFYGVLFFEFNYKLSYNLAISFVIAHTLNWIINCNLFVLIVHRIKWFKTSNKKLFNQLYSIQYRLKKMQNKDWILYSVSHGGICNGTLNKHSDIDVILIRKPGLANLFRAVVFYIKEKKYADLKGVPLDIFICDTPENCIERSKRQKNPIVLLDHNDKVDYFYPEKLSLSIKEAMLLNGVKPF